MLYNLNYERLVNAIADRGLTSKDVADQLEISEKLYLLKLCNHEEFTMGEIQVFVEQILKISPEEIPDYFFCQKA